jgi:hypothetical protein
MTDMYEINETHDPKLKSWVESANDPDTDFPIQNLPFCRGSILRSVALHAELHRFLLLDLPRYECGLDVSAGQSIDAEL